MAASRRCLFTPRCRPLPETFRKWPAFGFLKVPDEQPVSTGHLCSFPLLFFVRSIPPQLLTAYCPQLYDRKEDDQRKRSGNYAVAGININNIRNC